MSVPPETVQQENPRSGLSDVLMTAFPVIVAVASATVMQFVDFWMVAKVGTDETAAITPAAILVFTVISFLIGLLSCNNTFVSQSHVKQNFTDCARYTWQALYISLIGGSLALFLWPVAPKLFELIGHEAELQRWEIVYFRIRLFSVFSCAAVTGLSGFYQGIGRPRIIMWTALVANALNIFLNWVLIFGKLGFPPMGVAGAALATVISMGVQAGTLLLVFLIGNYARKYQSRQNWQWDSKRMGELFHIGWASGLQFSLDLGCWGIFNTLVIGRLGKTQLAASNIAGQIMHLSFMPTIGLSIATTALVAQNIGRGDIATARARGETAIRLGVAYMFSMGVLFLIFRKPLIGLFRTEPEIVALGSRVLIIVAAFQFFDALCIVCGGALKGAGDTRFPAMMHVIYAWVIFLPISYVLTYRLNKGLVGAWLGACVFIIIFGVTLLWRWRGHAWERIDIFARKPFPRAELPGHVAMYEPSEEIFEATSATPVEPLAPPSPPEQEDH